MQKIIKTQIHLHRTHDFHHPPVTRVAGLVIAMTILFYVSSIGFHGSHKQGMLKELPATQIFAEYLQHEKETHRHLSRLDTCLRLPTVSGL